MKLRLLVGILVLGLIIVAPTAFAKKKKKC